jgi:serine/threonine protein kinase
LVSSDSWAKTNVVIDRNGIAVLADFGLSVALVEADRSYYNSYSVGAVRWLAPELASVDHENVGNADFPKPTRQSDIFSLGCIMLEVDRICQTLVQFYLMPALHRSSQVDSPSGGMRLLSRSSTLGISA